MSRILHGFTYVHHTDSLAFTRLVVVRRNALSRFCSRPVCYWTSLHCLARCFIQSHRVIWWYRWFTLYAVNNASYDLTSHRKFLGRIKSHYWHPACNSFLLDVFSLAADVQRVCSLTVGWQNSLSAVFLVLAPANGRKWRGIIALRWIYPPLFVPFNKLSFTNT